MSIVGNMKSLYRSPALSNIIQYGIIGFLQEAMANYYDFCG